MAYQADYVLLVVVAVGVGGYVAALVGAYLVLVDDPFEGTAVAQAVVEDLAGDFTLLSIAETRIIKSEETGHETDPG